MKNEGAIKKVGNFLGISKFGQGIATATRVISGEVGKDIARQNQNTEQVNKIIYAAKQEQDPEKRKRLLKLATSMGSTSAAEIDPGLNLSNREVLGSAANVALNVLTPGAFKGGKAAILGKNAAMGAGYGAASGLEKGRSAKGVVGSAVGGAIIGGAIGGVGLMAKSAKEFMGAKVPEWMMNKAVKPALQDLKKNVKYGTDTLGKELLDEGVKGGPKKLLEIADDKISSLEDELTSVLSSPSLKGAKITRGQIEPYMKDLLEAKAGTPGMQGDVQRIKNVFDSLPEEMTLQQANQMKRRIYNELRDVAYKMDAKLGTKANALKSIARGLKSEIETSVGGNVVQDINKKLSIYGRLENSMVDQLAREMRNNGVGLTDAILLAGGDTTSILALLRHVGQGSQTHIAQALSKINNVGTGRVANTTKSLLKRGTLNLP